MPGFPKAMNPESLVVNKEILSLLPGDVCRRHKVVPLDRIQNSLLVAMVNPGDAQALDDIRFMTALDVEPVPATERSVVEAIETHYPCERRAPEEPSRFDEGLDLLTKLETGTAGAAAPTEPDVGAVVDAAHDTDASSGESPVVRLVEAMLAQAVEQGASHAHFEPTGSGVRVRLRVDGLLRDVATLPLGLTLPVVSRLKILARLDIAERRLPQDGRITLKLANGRRAEAIVGTLPTSLGERIVLTLTGGQVRLTPIEELGFPLDDLEQLKQAACLPSGLVLIAGPPRSGRSTTQYSLLGYLNTGARCILTMEDPIAHLVDGINQVQVRGEVGYSYAVVLKAFVRQDPDVIMVQEIADAETATAVLQTSLEGCLVLGAVEAADAPAALLALVRLGAPAGLVASAVRFVVAQRLVRKLCDRCKVDEGLSALDQERLSALGKQGVPAGQRVFRAVGCSVCGHAGYRGRIPVAEMLLMSQRVRTAIADSAVADDLRAVAVGQGMRTFAGQALKRALSGETTLDECWRLMAASASDQARS
ncbi:MAG: GspE/PulE family protein [Acidobacteriota bacterium]